MIRTHARFKAFLFAALVGGLPAVCVASPPSDTQVELARVAQLEVSRQNERSAWKPFVGHASVAVRSAAMKALGRVQAERTVPLLSRGLKDTSPQVRTAAARAIGQLEQGGMHAIRARLKQEKEASVRLVLVEALGRRGSRRDIKFLTSILRGTDSESKARAFVALSLIARRTSGQLPGFVGELATGALTDPSPNVRFGAAQVLFRARKVQYRDLATALGECLNDEVSDIRALCVRVMGRLGKAGRGLRDEASKDPDWQVHVALARADGRAGDNDAIGERMDRWAARLETGVLQDDSPLFHPVLAIIDAALSKPTNEQIVKGAQALYGASIQTPPAPVVRPDSGVKSDSGSPHDAGIEESHKRVPLSDAGVGNPPKQEPDASSASTAPPTRQSAVDLRLSHINCGAATLIDRQQRARKLTRICGGAEYPQRFREKWMARVADELKESQRIKVYEKFFREFDTDGQLVVLEALSNFVSRRKTDGLLLEALQSHKGAVVGTAANVAVSIRPEGIETHLIDTYRRVYALREFEAVQSIFDALGRLESVAAKGVLDRHTDANHPGVKQAALNAIKVIEAAEERALREANSAQGHLPQRSAFAPPPPQRLSGEAPDLGIIEAPEFARATIVTNRGPIEITFLTAKAPRTSKHFARLVQRQFYDNLIFHRVVPNFVVQGGDPDGDGWGGPGYTIPCEVNATEFGTGVLGMALSGKDTGGSQFFITHSPQPHLNGKYTAFARVTKGQSVVASLGEGDRIIKVKLHRRN